MTKSTNIKRFTEKYDDNQSQECICHRGPMLRGLEEQNDGEYVEYEEYQKLLEKYKSLKNEDYKNNLETVGDLVAYMMEDQNVDNFITSVVKVGDKEIEMSFRYIDGLSTTDKLYELQKENINLKRLKSEWEKIYEPIRKYCEEQNIGKLGIGYTEALIESHQELNQNNKRLDKDLGMSKSRENQLIDTLNLTLSGHVLDFIHVGIMSSLKDSDDQSRAIDVYYNQLLNIKENLNRF